MKKLLVTAAAAALITTPAFAGALIFEPEPEPMVEVAPAPPPPPMLPDWTGPYAGIQAGWAMVDADDDDDDIFYGGHLGFDYDLGGFVLGGELAYDRLDIDAGATEIDQRALAVLKAGYSLGQTLLYAKGGASWLDGEDSTGAGQDEFGWVAGAGVEHRITENISGGLEYLYNDTSDFGADDVEIQSVGARLTFRF